MIDLLKQMLINIEQPLLIALGLFALFACLEKITPCNRNQPIFHRGMLTDAAYFFIIPIFTKIVFIFYIRAGVFLMFQGESDQSVTSYIMNGFGPMGRLPVWLQSALAFIFSDIILYWTHRLFHRKKLWKIHAIHHSAVHVNWHSTYRFHPINIWLTFTLVNIFMIFIGLSMQSMINLTLFNTVYSAMVHANLNWTFGPFKHIFASPVFHRWHHTSQEEGMDKNFAPTFPLLDIMFGTFYMPDGQVPQQYGISGKPLPESFISQLFWPFKNDN